MPVRTSRPEFIPTYTPSQLPGLTLQLDASDSGSFTYSSATLVSQWSDLSGNANHATQSSSGQRPDRSGTQNGLSTVVYDGINDFFNLPSIATIDSLTYIAVVKTNNAAVNQCMFSGGGGAAEWRITEFNTQLAARENNYNIAESVGTIGTGWCVIALAFPDASTPGYFWRNGTVDSVIGAANHNTGAISQFGRNASGANQYWSGEMAEVLMYSIILSIPMLKGLYRHLASKWGI